ncbi:tyrosine-protein phosphatase [Kitasatospora sp. NBC_01287]|uniref:tyrosine-protein phosphatase n=1 Tax=Kitasatospora sp. NBC_01287 TaxID=2903573 RepID=UPI00224DBE7A|nr:tyrosine-protein phosphatase [Kitasatospora sp. NBC_01287]MCX4747451.1 tyrosine-protein phosphatase [Kitasatospora sp. NBC_01287]
MDESLNGSRLLAISGLRNLRDLGGLGAVRPGLLYRSGWLAELTSEGTRELAKLDLRTVIDLRDAIELAQRPDRTEGLDVVLANLPLLPQGAGNLHGLPAQELYPLLVDTAGPVVVAVLRRLLEPGALPALVHCAVGRDRTGIVLALLLDLLGVPEEEIVADYLLSNEGLGLLDGPGEYVDPSGVVRLSHPVEAYLITDVLARVREQHGSAEAYLTAHGLNAAEILDLRATLRE